MTKTLTLFSFLSFFGVFIGSTQEYSVEYSTREYVPLSDANLLDESDPLFESPGIEIYNNIPIGFIFEYNGIPYDSVRIGEYGFAIFEVDGGSRSFINIFECAQKNAPENPAASPIYYETTGELGDRIFKLEFINSRLEFDDDNVDYVNYQLWIYENCDVFEFHMGEHSIDTTEAGLFFNGNSAPFIGYGKSVPYVFFGLTEDLTDPILDSDHLNSLDAVPTEGIVYTFRKCFASTPNEDINPLKVYPNPAAEFVNLKMSTSNPTTLRIFDINGKIVHFELLPTSPSHTIDISSLPRGTYTIETVSDDQINRTKLIRH